MPNAGCHCGGWPCWVREWTGTPTVMFNFHGFLLGSTLVMNLPNPANCSLNQDKGLIVYCSVRCDWAFVKSDCADCPLHPRLYMCCLASCISFSFFFFFFFFFLPGKAHVSVKHDIGRVQTRVASHSDFQPWLPFLLFWGLTVAWWHRG